LIASMSSQSMYSPCNTNGIESVKYAIYENNSCQMLSIINGINEADKTKYMDID